MGFDPDRFIEENVGWLKRTIGDGKAFAATSGGVDSTVSAVLAHRAIGKRAVVGFLDDGLMREGEPEEVLGKLKALGLNAKLYRVREPFFKAFKGLTDPEEKRRAFRDTFYNTFSKVAKEEGAEYLIQGTIAADVVETKGGVKTQHNVLDQMGVNTMDRFGFRLLEPLLDLYKDQVRAVARHLGVKEASERQPFPGPGLMVRCIGEVKEAKVESLRKATAITEGHLNALPSPPKQFLAAIVEDDLTPASPEVGEALKKVLPTGRAYYLKGLATGVKGDDRAYGKMLLVSRGTADPNSLFSLPEKMIHADKGIVRVLYALPGPKNRGEYVAIVRAVETRDFMTVKPSEIPLKTLRSIALEVLKDPKVSIVAYDLTSKPPATVEFE